MNDTIDNSHDSGLAMTLRAEPQSPSPTAEQANASKPGTYEVRSEAAVLDVPHFIIIGAMKCATTTLHEQLALQPEFFMTSKIEEPSFFSDDSNYNRGITWYRTLFANRGSATLCGESSTNYTKLPDLPHTVERMQRHLPKVKLIYVMRHPVDRLVSHYIHDWTERRIDEPIGDAIHRHAEMISYGKYAMQLEPYLDAFGPSRILPIFFESLVKNPDSELKRVYTFLGLNADAQWHREEAPQNVSKDRLRRSGLRDAIIWNPAVTWLRRTFIPQGVRDWVKSWFQMRERPVLSASELNSLERTFDEDIVVLGRWFDLKLSCATWKSIAEITQPHWVGHPLPPALSARKEDA